MSNVRNIRLGLVRCDTHGYWYAPFFAPCDRRLLEKNDPPCNHYFFGDIFDPEKLCIPQVSGFDLVKVWDADPQRAADFSETFLGTAQVCDTLEEMADGVDAVFIADCSGDGSDHVKLATPFLERSIPVYVDKPFAPCLEDARTLVNLAQKNQTCVMSGSLLEHNPQLNRWAQSFNEIGGAGLVVVKGVGAYGLAGIIHGIGMVRNILGEGVEWVQAMGHTPLDPASTRELNSSPFAEWTNGEGRVPAAYLHLQYKSRQAALIVNAPVTVFPDICWFFASAYGKGGALHSPPIGDPEFPAGGEVILKLFRKMVRSGKPAIPYDSMLEKIAILDAAQLSQQQGSKRVYLEEL